MSEETPPPIATRSVRWVGWLLFAALGVLLLYDVAWLKRPIARGPTVGGPAPDVEVRQLGPVGANSVEFRLSAELGHPVLLDFWATWCGPCKESLPILDAVYRRMQPSGLRAIAIESSGDEQVARAFAARLGLSMPIGLDNGEAAGRYAVTSIPHLVLVGRDGKIIRIFRGVHSATEIERAILSAGQN